MYAAEHSFDNASPLAVQQLHWLGEVLNGFSHAALLDAGLKEGQHCWDVGAGAGALTDWMAEQVAPSGSVLATDLAPLGESAGLVRWQTHDVLADPLPTERFDIVHCRQLLMHLPDQGEVLRRLASTVDRGGVVVSSDWYFTGEPAPLRAPNAAAERLLTRFLTTAREAIRGAGGDLTWGERSARVAEQAGLRVLDRRVESARWFGGGPAAMLYRVNIHQLRARFDSLSDNEIEQILELLGDPEVELPPFPFVTIRCAP